MTYIASPSSLSKHLLLQFHRTISSAAELSLEVSGFSFPTPCCSLPPTQFRKKKTSCTKTVCIRSLKQSMLKNRIVLGFFLKQFSSVQQSWGQRSHGLSISNIIQTCQRRIYGIAVKTSERAERVSWVSSAQAGNLFIYPLIQSGFRVDK